LIRNELIYDEMIAQLTPYHAVRIAPAWPPAIAPAQVDLLLFTDSTYTLTDYSVLTKLSSLLGLNLTFFDYEHFFSINNNIAYSSLLAKNEIPSIFSKIQASLWEAFLGKTTILWFPTRLELSSMGNMSDFIRHLQANGSFTNGGAYVNQNPLSLPKEMNHFLSKEARNAVKLPESFAIHSIKDDLAHVINEEKMYSNNTGNASILQFVISIFLSMKLEKKLQFLFDRQSSRTLDIVLSPTIQLTDYHSELDTSCCANCMGGGKKNKIFPSNKSPLTVRDVLCVAIRTEVMMDLGAFASGKAHHVCYSINTTLAFIERALGPMKNSRASLSSAGNKPLSYWARDMVAIVYSSNILEKDKFSTNDLNRNFLPLQNKIRVTLAQCQQLAEASRLDYERYAERLGDLDIVNGFSAKRRGVNSDHDPINVGNGITLHLAAKFN
jgi:hypothetical protein